MGKKTLLSLLCCAISVNAAVADSGGEDPAVQNISSFAAVRSVMPHRSPVIERAQVSIRIIEAEGGEADAAKLNEERSIIVDPRLEDLKDKFIHLPYSEFRLNAETSKFIAIKQKEPIRFMNGQRIYLRVIDYTDTESTLWLRWLSAAGEVLLDTRMGVMFNDAMVVGVDQMTPDRHPDSEVKDGQGMVLAVKVSPIVTVQ